MKVKIFGERNTGTNLISQLLKQNFMVELCPGTVSEISPELLAKLKNLRETGATMQEEENFIDTVFANRPPMEWWKHSATRFSADEVDDIHLIFTTREPLSWLVGLYRSPHHILIDKPHNLLDFSQSDWQVVGRDNVEKRFYTPLRLYAEKLKSYRSLIRKLEVRHISHTLIKFEEAVTDQNSIYRMLTNIFEPVPGAFKEIAQSTKDRNKNSAFYASYYASETWREEFPEIHAVQNPIDEELSSFFGFEQ